MIDSNETFAVRITIADDVYASILCATSYDLSALRTCVVPCSGINGEGAMRARRTPHSRIFLPLNTHMAADLTDSGYMGFL